MKDGKVFVTDYNIHIVLRKMRIDLRKAYQLQEIIAIISKEISENGFTDEDYCLYSHEDMLTPEVVCYLETYPTISSDDKDVYPNFVVMESLVLLYYGEQCKDSGCIKQEYVGIRTRKGWYSMVLTDRVFDLSHFSTNKDMSKTL